MEVYNEIKRDFLKAFCILIVVTLLCNQFDIGTDKTDKDGWNRSGFKLLKDYGTGKEYLYKNGAIVERK